MNENTNEAIEVLKNKIEELEKRLQELEEKYKQHHHGFIDFAKPINARSQR